MFRSGRNHLWRSRNLHLPRQRHACTQTRNKAPTPTKLKRVIWQHQLTPDTHTNTPPLTLQHFKTNQNCSWDQRCGYNGQRVIHFVHLCVCVCVLWRGRDTSEIEAGEVRGGTHPLNPPLLTCEHRDGAERSTANRINWSITSHLSGGTKAPLKKQQQRSSPTWTMRRGTSITSRSVLPGRSPGAGCYFSVADFNNGKC